MAVDSNKCAFCGETGITRLSDYDDLLFCGNCSTAFYDSMPSDAQLEEFYKNQYWETANNPIKAPTHQHTQLFTNIIKKHNPKAKTVCDIGCGHGALLNGLNQNGFDVTGLEYSQSAINYINEDLGLKAKQGSIRSLSSKYDVITILHMIEHSNSPFSDLQHVISRLNTNGLLFVSVPNFNSLAAKVLKKEWEWYTSPSHLFYFALDSFKYFCKSNNLEIIFTTTKMSGTQPLSSFLSAYLESQESDLDSGIKDKIHSKKSFLSKSTKSELCDIFEAMGLGEDLIVVMKVKN